jgi:hypothetical protein
VDRTLLERSGKIHEQFIATRYSQLRSFLWHRQNADPGSLLCESGLLPKPGDSAHWPAPLASVNLIAMTPIDQLVSIVRSMLRYQILAPNAALVRTWRENRYGHLLQTESLAR